MAQSINTFAVVLLAFPFYLAQKGRLVGYIDLAKPGAENTATVTPAATAAGASSAPSENQGSGMDTAALMQKFSEASALFT